MRGYLKLIGIRKQVGKTKQFILGDCFCPQKIVITIQHPIMAKSLIVRNLGDEVFAKLRLRVARSGRSVEPEHREILKQALLGEIEIESDFLEMAAKFRETTKDLIHIPSEQLLCEGRRER